MYRESALRVRREVRRQWRLPIPGRRYVLRIQRLQRGPLQPDNQCVRQHACLRSDHGRLQEWSDMRFDDGSLQVKLLDRR